jgi:hypothetical protein
MKMPGYDDDQIDKLKLKLDETIEEWLWQN